ncbi:acyl-CoA thioesterase [Flavobacterium sp. JP2137]|uniref:acyl-CoA thioesterase n=1 Tax=Flavobacterium sp. JP2137 TaxID=3414510 RepID=UPI003D2FE26E
MTNNNIYKSRKWVKPEDLNANSTLFGGKLLAWIDEEAALFAVLILKNRRVVTKYMTEINFMSSARQSDIIEIQFEITKFGKTSLQIKCSVFNIMTKESIITVEAITMVHLGEDGKPTPHGLTDLGWF